MIAAAPTFSLDQLAAFVAVVETGSFSAAGRRLGRVQSAISYAVGQLEGALGAELFDRSGHTPTLTGAGQRLVAEARLVLSQARDLESCAGELRDGVESQLRVLVDAVYPASRLADVCMAFHEQFPRTALRLELGILQDVVAAVREGRAELGIANLAGRDEVDLLVAHIGAVRLIPVCAPQHPLARASGRLSESTLRRHVQIVHAERRRAPGDDQGVLAAHTWRVTDLATKRDLILRGIGWGSLPGDVALPLIERGELVRVRPAPWPTQGHRVELHAVARHDQPLGRAGQWLSEALALLSEGEAA